MAEPLDLGPTAVREQLRLERAQTEGPPHPNGVGGGFLRPSPFLRPAPGTPAGGELPGTSHRILSPPQVERWPELSGLFEIMRECGGWNNVHAAVPAGASVVRERAGLSAEGGGGGVRGGWA